MCLPCPHVTNSYLDAANNIRYWIYCFHVVNKSPLHRFFFFLTTFTSCLLFLWCASEHKPGVNNRARSIPQLLSESSPSPSCLLFRPIICLSVCSLMLLGRIMVDHNAFSLVVWVELLVGNCSHDLYKVGRYTVQVSVFLAKFWKLFRLVVLVPVITSSYALCIIVNFPPHGLIAFSIGAVYLVEDCDLPQQVAERSIFSIGTIYPFFLFFPSYFSVSEP